jgi:hypothetical protein
MFLLLETTPSSKEILRKKLRHRKSARLMFTSEAQQIKTPSTMTDPFSTEHPLLALLAEINLESKSTWRFPNSKGSLKDTGDGKLDEKPGTPR